MSLRGFDAADIQSRTSHVAALDTSLTRWWNDVEECLELGQDSPSTGITAYNRLILTVLRFESVIAINRTIIASSKSEVEYNAALQNCIHAARSIISSLFEALSPRVPLSETDTASYASPLLWSSFTWAIWMSAFIIVHSLGEKQISETSGNRYIIYDHCYWISYTGG